MRRRPLIYNPVQYRLLAYKKFKPDEPEDRAMRIASVGHAVFAATMIALGILGLIKGDFSPVWEPGTQGRARTRGAGLSLRLHLPGIRHRPAMAAHSRPCRPRAAGLSPVLVAAVQSARTSSVRPLRKIPGRAGETAVMVAAAWVLYAWFAADWDKRRLGFATGDKGCASRGCSTAWP